MRYTIFAAVIAAMLAPLPAVGGSLSDPVVAPPVMAPAVVMEDTAANSSANKGMMLTLFMAVLMFSVTR